MAATEGQGDEGFESARLKIARAEHHARELLEEIERWLEQPPYQLTLRRDPANGEEAARST